MFFIIGSFLGIFSGLVYLDGWQGRKAREEREKELRRWMEGKERQIYVR